MITHVHLHGWKAYRTFDIDLEPGTTFLVAPNGVGKSSFIDAVRWALCETAVADPDYMRRGVKDTTVTVDLVVDDKAVRVTRQLTRGRGKTPKMTVEASVDGEAVKADDAFRTLADTWNAENRFWTDAAFLTERFADTKPDLRRHLTKLYALDHLQTAADALTASAKETLSEADNARKGTHATSKSVENAIADAAAAQTAADEASAEAERLREAASAAAEDLRLARDAARARQIHENWTRQRNELIADVEKRLGSVPSDIPLPAFIRAAEAGARQQLEELAGTRARLDERVAAVDQALDRLHHAGADCPVCRRPLDAHTRALAEEQHQHDRDTAVGARERIDVTGPRELAQALRSLTSRADQLGSEPEVPPGDVPDVEAADQRSRAAAIAFESALGEAARTREVADSAHAALRALQSQAGPSPAVGLYTRAAAFSSAAAALTETISEVLEAQLGPVRAEVNRRWESVFPNRQGLAVDADGAIVRVFDDEHPDLKFESFSAGERVVATVLLRVAALTAMTRIPFCVIDEPLEHLDPDARRYVAQTLAHLSGAGALRQIFVTTYEQDLALQLADRFPDVHLEFLRSAPPQS